MQNNAVLQGSNRAGIQFILALLAGALYAAGFPIKGLPPLGLPTFFGLGILFYLLRDSLSGERELPLKKMILTILGFSLGHYQLGFYWIPYTLKEFGGLEAPLNYLLGLGFSAVIVPQLWCFILIIYFLRKKAIAPRITSNHALLAALLTLLESLIPQQFPAHAGHVWMAFPPLTHLASYFGAPFYSFITYFVVLKLVQAKRRSDYFYGATVAMLVVLASLFTPSSWHQGESSESIRVKLVQPNVGNFMKIASEAGDNLALKDVFARYLELSTAADESAVDLIVWPETAYPRLIQSSAMKSAPALVKRVMEQTGADVLTGGYDQNPRANLTTQFETEYNTAFLFKADDQSLSDSYHKMKLIPFGEGLPFGPLNGVLSKYITNISYFAKGEKHTLFRTRKDARFITPICYEILFDSFIADYLNANAQRPHFILNLTNDSWYGITSEPYQHLFLAKWRASEFQLPLVRMTNTGVTSVIYPDGSESERIELDLATAKTYEIALKESRPTLFQRIGLLGVMIFALIFFAIDFTRGRSPL